MNKNKALLSIIISLLMVAGCGRGTEKGKILVSIGDVEVSVSDFENRIENLPERYREIVKKRKKEYLDEFINDTLLYQEAIRNDLDRNNDVINVIEEAKKKILIARLLKDEVDDSIKITDVDIEEFYNKNGNMYMTPEIMRVSHILLPTQEEAAFILQSLSNGEKFEDLAKAKSMDPTAQRAGDIGYFPKGQLMPEFENACSSLDLDEISNVVKTKLGYHIIKLTDRKKPKIRPISEVESDIKSRLHSAKRQVLFNQLLSKLRKETIVTINENLLNNNE